MGSLEPGKRADLILLDAPTYRHLGYRFGTNLVQAVVVEGKVLKGKQKSGGCAAARSRFGPA